MSISCEVTRNMNTWNHTNGAGGGAGPPFDPCRCPHGPPLADPPIAGLSAWPPSLLVPWPRLSFPHCACFAPALSKGFSAKRLLFWNGWKNGCSFKQRLLQQMENPRSSPSSKMVLFYIHETIRKWNATCTCISQLYMQLSKCCSILLYSTILLQVSLLFLGLFNFHQWQKSGPL